MPVQQLPLRTAPPECAPGGLRILCSGLEQLHKTSKLQPPRRPHQQLRQRPSIHHLRNLVGSLSRRTDADHVTSVRQLSESLVQFAFIGWVQSVAGASHSCSQSFESVSLVLHRSAASGGAHVAAGESTAAGSELVARSGAGGRAVPGLPGRCLHSPFSASRAPACHLFGGLTPVRCCIGEAVVCTPISCRR